jgi:signal transduction histidine kinase
VFFDPEEGWRGVVGLLISGIGHDLNGRLTALLGVAHVARHAAGADRDLLEVLDDQVRRLEQTIRALRGWPVGGSSSLELTRLKDLMPPLLELYDCRGGGGDPNVRVEEGPSNAIRLRSRPFMEAVLLLLAAAEHGDGGRHRPLVVGYGSDEGDAWLRIEARDGAGSASVSNRSVEEARGLVERAGGRLSVAEPLETGLRFEVRLPEAS